MGVFGYFGQKNEQKWVFWGILAGIMNSNGYFGKKNEQKWVFWQE